MHHRAIGRIAALSTLFAIATALLVAPAASSAAPTGRITNGKAVSDATFGSQWGFLVSIQYNMPMGEPSDRMMHNCGGSLIAPDLVLTAEHCTPWHLRMLPIANLKIQVAYGSRTLSDKAVTKTKRVDVVDVWHHPDTSEIDSLLLPSHDVAILKLARPITDAPTVKLIGAGEGALWGAGAGLPTGAKVAGWGITRTDPEFISAMIDDEDDPRAELLMPAKQLQEVAVPLHSHATCESSDTKMYIDAGMYDRDTMLCAGSLDAAKGAKSSRKGACMGDSGGPLVVPAANGEVRLAGVVSWGPNANGGCNSFSIFANVDSMRTWVEQVIASNGPARSVTAPASVTSQPTSVNSLRLSWPKVAGTAKHVYVSRVITQRERAIDLATDPINLKDVPMDERAEASAYQRIQPNVFVAAGGRDTQSLVVRGVAPRKSSALKPVRLRVVVESADGSYDVSPDFTVPAPVDDTAPARPKAPRVVGTQRGAVKLWWPKVSDNDCVRRYVVQVRRSGSGKWVDRSGRSADRCPDFRAVITGFDFGAVIAIIDRMYGLTTPRPNDFRATRMEAGTWQVRIVAVDRAGNSSTGPARTVRVPKTITAAKDEGYCCSSFSFMMGLGFEAPKPSGSKRESISITGT